MVKPGWTRRAAIGAGIAAPVALLAAETLRSTGGSARISHPLRCADFLAMIGVNTHLRYVRTQYNAIDAVQAALGYCGINRLRDIAISAQAPNADHYDRLAQAGMRFCLAWGNGRTMADAIGQIAALEARHPGCVEFLEGANEIQPRFAYGGETGLAAGQKFMVDMKAAAAAEPVLRNKRLVSFTSAAPAASVADFANHHPYPKNGAQPGELIRQRHDQWVGPGAPMAGKPMVFTEFGYHTLVGRPMHPGHWQGVDEAAQAVLLLNGLFDAAAAGLSHCYIYQLFDGMRDGLAQPPSQENHFGLFRSDGQPKPAATAIRALTSLLADDSPGARKFALAPPALHVAAEGPVNVLPLQNGLGRSWLVLWQEPPLWDAAAMARAPVVPLAVSVTLPRPARFKKIAVTGNGDNGEQAPGTSARVVLHAEPVLLEIA